MNDQFTLVLGTWSFVFFCPHIGKHALSRIWLNVKLLEQWRRQRPHPQTCGETSGCSVWVFVCVGAGGGVKGGSRQDVYGGFF